MVCHPSQTSSRRAGFPALRQDLGDLLDVQARVVRGLALRAVFAPAVRAAHRRDEPRQLPGFLRDLTAPPWSACSSAQSAGVVRRRGAPEPSNRAAFLA